MTFPHRFNGGLVQLDSIVAFPTIEARIYRDQPLHNHDETLLIFMVQD